MKEKKPILTRLRLKKKYAVLLLVLGSISVLVLVLGLSYAFFTTSTSGSDVVVYTGNLEVNYTKTGNLVNLSNTYPMTNAQGLSTEGYTFNITNTGTMDAKYLIRLELDPTNTLPMEYIKLSYVKTKQNNNITDLPAKDPVLISNLNSTLTFVSDQVIETGKMDSYNLKLWIDYSAPNSIQGKTFKAKITVDAIQNVEKGYAMANTIPIITLDKYENGEIDAHLKVNDTFTDPGIESVRDDKDLLTEANVTKTYEYTSDGTNLTTVNGIDTSVAGVYYINYEVTDSDNLVGRAARVVTVNNTTAIPNITLNGSSSMMLNKGNTFTDPGATTSTAGAKVVAIGDVKTTAVGTYIVKYIVIDRNGNVNSLTRSVTVIGEGPLGELVEASNILKTDTPNFAKAEPTLLSYTDNGFVKPIYNINMANYNTKYYTYADSYSFDTATGKYTLVNPQVCQYNNCWQVLLGKYIVSQFGSSNTTAANSSNLSKIYLVENNTTADKLYYENSKSTENYDNSSSGLYKMSVTNGYGGQDGDTYYYRGNVSNNKVLFADFEWKIIRVNEDGTIRLILDSIANDYYYKFNSDYPNVNSIYYSNSEVKGVLETWFNENITGDNASKVATGNYFCEAAKVEIYPYDWYTIGSAVTSLYTEYTPDLKCETDGNGKGLVNASIGLITYDEAVLAGAYVDTQNRENYLYIDAQHWTMSPASYDSAIAQPWEISFYTSLDTCSSSGELALRPVINLKADTIAIYNVSTGCFEIQ